MRARGRRRVVSEPGRPAGEASKTPIVMSFPLPAPQPLVAAAEDGRPMGSPVTGAQAEASGKSEAPATHDAPRLQLPRAKDDRPESWGERADDLGDFLRAERPPHW